MSDWSELAIGSLLSDSFAGDWGNPPNGQPTFVLRATDIDDDGHIRSDGAARSVATGILGAKRLRNGDLIIEASGGSPDRPVGRVAYFDRESEAAAYLCSNFFRTLRPRSGVCPRFLFWMLHWFHKQPAILSLQQQTTGIINLRFPDFLAATLHVPSLQKEQSVIARILDTLDTRIERTQALIAKLEQIKEGLLQDLLTRGVDDDGELRPSPEEAPDLYKESSLGLIPQSWRALPITAYLREQDGIKPGPFGSSLKKESYTRVGFKVYGQEQVIAGNQSIGDYFVSDEKFAELKDFSVQEGDILISLVGTVGRVLVLTEGCMPGLINPRLMRLRRHASVCTSEFVKLILMSASFARQIETLSGGGTMPVINKSTVERVVVPCVPLREQAAIVEKERAIVRWLVGEQGQLRKLQVQKAGLMDDLLTGRVRVTPLLEREAAAAS